MHGRVEAQFKYMPSLAGSVIFPMCIDPYHISLCVISQGWEKDEEEITSLAWVMLLNEKPAGGWSAKISPSSNKFPSTDEAVESE